MSLTTWSAVLKALKDMAAAGIHPEHTAAVKEYLDSQGIDLASSEEEEEDEGSETECTDEEEAAEQKIMGDEEEAEDADGKMPAVDLPIQSKES